MCCTGTALTADMINDMMREMPPLINENDLHVSQVPHRNIYRTLEHLQKPWASLYVFFNSLFAKKYMIYKAHVTGSIFIATNK